MPRPCSICEHDRRGELEAALVGNGTSLRDIAGRYGVSKSALSRHKSEHLPAKLTKARDAEEIAEADDLLGQIRDLQRRTLSVLSGAEEDGEKRTALKAVAEARRNIELLGKLAGELQQEGTTVIHVERLQAVVLQALEEYPDAQAHVARALYDSDTGG